MQQLAEHPECSRKEGHFGKEIPQTAFKIHKILFKKKKKQRCSQIILFHVLPQSTSPSAREQALRPQEGWYLAS